MFATVFAQNDIRIYVNGMRANGDVIVKNNTTYVPLRTVSEALGAEVNWDGSTNSVYVTLTEEDAIAKVVADVSSSVVTIVGNSVSSDIATSYNNYTMHGTGVIYKSNGYIITNAHVVKDIKNLTVVFSDGTMLPGNVLFSDEIADLAIVKVNKIGLNTIAMADINQVESGKTAIAIGTPVSLSMRNTVTKGVICAVGVAMGDSHYKLIQTDATVNPGNSGGPLLNTKGELIGINSSKYASVSIDNMAFAIPVDTVQHAISQYEKNGEIRRPKVNFTLENSWEAKIGLPTSKGINVKKSTDTDIYTGDVIESVNGIAVHSIADWNEAIKKTYNGILDIVLVRGGAHVQVNIQR
jgi:serine protease Do